MSNSRGLHDCSGYVLRCRPFMEGSRIVDLFVPEHSLVSAINKGSRRLGRGKKVATLAKFQLFQGFSFSLRMKTGMAVLQHCDVQPPHRLLAGKALYVGLYLNELLLRLLAIYEPKPTLFEAYVAALDALVLTTDFEPVLRRFERVFLESIGYGITWHLDADDGTDIDPEACYRFIPEGGFYKNQTPRPDGISGADILAIHAACFDVPRIRRIAKNIMRQAFASHLGGKPLQARALFSA